MKKLSLITATIILILNCNAQQFGSITDSRDDQVYKTVRIGTQWWMAQNLNYYTPTGSVYYNSDSIQYAHKYGRLYTWTTGNESCPSGWHMSTHNDWKALEGYLGIPSNSYSGIERPEPNIHPLLGTNQGGMLKKDTSLWQTPNTGATNTTGFSAVPAGVRYGNDAGNFAGKYGDIGTCAHFWSSLRTGNIAFIRVMAYNNAQIEINDFDKSGYRSVRCVEDEIPDSAKYFGQTPPGNVPVQFATGIINGYVHGTIAISLKGDEIYWVVNPSTERIMYSKFENGTWTVPALADFVKDYLTNNNGNPTFSPDGKKLFFYSDRPGGLGSYDTWYVEKTDSGWSTPINAGAPYNTADADLTPLFTNKGNAYHLGYNNKHEEITYCYKYSNNNFTDPTPMNILPEYGPWWTLYISPEEEYLIFAGGADNADLYIRFKEKEDQWGTPINMGNKINTSVDERFPVVSPDGKYLFFERELNSNNLFWVSTSIIDSLKNTVTGIKISEANKKVIVFPNPTSQSIHIEGVDMLLNESSYQLTDLNGKTIKQGKLKSETIDISELPIGIYVLSLHTNKGIVTEKIVIE